MAIKIKAVGSAAVETYIPEFGGEREALKADSEYPAAAFHLRQLTEGEYDKAAGLSGLHEPADVRDNRVFDLLGGAFAVGVVACENFSLEVDGKEIDITTGAEFAKHKAQLPFGQRFLIGEVANRIIKISALSKDEEKN